MQMPRVRPTSLLLVFLLSIVVGQIWHGHLLGVEEASPVRIVDKGMAVVANSYSDNTTEVADLARGDTAVMNQLVAGHWMNYYEISNISSCGSWHSVNFVTTDGAGVNLVNVTVHFVAGPGVLTVYLDLGTWNITSPVSATERWNCA